MPYMNIVHRTEDNLTIAGWEAERSPSLGRCIAEHFAFSEEQLTDTPQLECGSDSCILTVQPQHLLRLLAENGWDVVSFSLQEENKIWILYKKENEKSREDNLTSDTDDQKRRFPDDHQDEEEER